MGEERERHRLPLGGPERGRLCLLRGQMLARGCRSPDTEVDQRQNLQKVMPLTSPSSAPELLNQKDGTNGISDLARFGRFRQGGLLQSQVQILGQASAVWSAASLSSSASAASSVADVGPCSMSQQAPSRSSAQMQVEPRAIRRNVGAGRWVLKSLLSLRNRLLHREELFFFFSPQMAQERSSWPGGGSGHGSVSLAATSTHGGANQRPSLYDHCVFCRNNGELPSYYKTHTLKNDSTGKVELSFTKKCWVINLEDHIILCQESAYALSSFLACFKLQIGNNTFNAILSFVSKYIFKSTVC